MKSIENIFTKKPPKPNCPNPATPIIIDTREKQSMVAALLLEKKANIKFEHLQIADYLVGDIAIERKTFRDFLSSMLNKRLPIQLREIKKYPKQFLILESFDFDYNPPEINIHENAIRGMLLSCILDFQIPIIFTEDETDTTNFLILLAKKQTKPKTPISLRPSRSSLKPEQLKQFILEGFPNIGPATAKLLLKKYKTIKNIINTPISELEKLIGKKAQGFGIVE